MVMVMIVAASFFFGWLFDNNTVGGEQQSSHTCGVLQRGTHNFGWIHNTKGNHVAVLVIHGVVAEIGLLFLLNTIRNNGAVEASVGSDHAKRHFENVSDEFCTQSFVALQAQSFNCSATSQQGYSTTRNNAFFNGGTCGCQSVVDKVLTFFHFRFGRRTDFDHSHSASQFGQTFLQLFAIILAVCVFDFATNLFCSTTDVSFLASTVHKNCLVSVNANCLGPSKI